MSARTLRFLATPLAVSLFWLSGCGKKAQFVPVSGVVTLNGEPLGGAAVVFTPTAENTEAAAGLDATGPAGNYKVVSQGRAGLVPGKYIVLVKKEQNPALANAEHLKMVDQAGNTIGDDPDMAKILAGGDQAQTGGQAAKSTKVEESFEREVPPEGAAFDFDLKAKPDEAKTLLEN